MASDQRSVSMSRNLAMTGSVWTKCGENRESGQGHPPHWLLSVPVVLGRGLDSEVSFSGIASS